MKAKVLLLIIGCLLFLNGAATAQLAGDQIFLQGKFLEVGVAPNGSWGNTMPVPAAYHTHGCSFPSYSDPITGTSATGNGLDFSYDPGHDGWPTGSPGGADLGFYGAFFLPGTPFDGWAIQMNGVRSDAYYTTAGFALGAGATAFTGTNNSYSMTLGSPCGPYLESSAAGFWSGTYTAGGGTLSIRATNRVDTNASWDKVNIVFKNTGATTITGLYYLATADPDNDVTIGSCSGSYPTNNHITYQNDAQHRVEVNARPPAEHQDAFSGLATKDCRAKAIIYQTWPSSITIPLSDFWGTVDHSTVSDLTLTKLDTTTFGQDIAYGLVFNLGNLAPGDSTGIAFAWIFSDTSAVDSAYQQPRLDVNCALVPNSYTLSPCPQTSFPVNIVNGQWGTTTWKWAPAVGLSTTVGITNSVNVLALSGTTVYTITPSDTASCDHFPPFFLTVLACFNASSNSPCIGDTLKLAAHGDSTGATYTWFGPGIGGPVLGTGQYLNIFPSTWADTGIIYVIKTVGTTSDTTSTHVIIRSLPVVVATSNAPICSQTALNLFATPASVGETFSWIGPNGFTSTLQNPIIGSTPVIDSGIYWVHTSLNGCIDSASVHVKVDSTPAVPVAGNNSPVCSGTYTLSLNATDVTPGVTYSWSGPGGYASTLQNPNISPVGTAAAGIYTVTVKLGSCRNSATTAVTVNPTPPVPTLGSNVPVCSGNALNLTATTTAGSTYSWAGPNGFASTLQNPVINPATTLASGTYSVIATLNGCPSPLALMAIVVDSTPLAPTPGSNTPVCAGGTLSLTATDATAGVSYSWAGPGGYLSTLQNPSITPVTTSASGTYTVTAILGGCRSFATTFVTIKPTPTAPTLTSNSPICSGTALVFTATTSAGSTFVWVGPNGFSSTLQNPSISPATTLATGNYSVVATLNGCPSSMAIIFAEVDSTPAAPVAGSNSPGVPSICERDTLKLFATDATAGVTFSWAGPNSFTSTLQNPVIPNVTAAATGLYTVTVSNGTGCTNLAVISVSISAVPPLSATSNSPVCTGAADTLFLHAIAPAGATFSWTGPYVFSSGNSDPRRDSVIFEYGGIYQVTAFLNGCKNTVDDTVIVIRTPAPPWVTDLTYCQYYLAAPLMAGGENILWYPTDTANGIGSPVPPLPPTSSDTVMWFFLTQTVDGCISALDSMKVTVNPKPDVWVTPADTAVCPRDSVILTAHDLDAIAYYSWSPSMYLNTNTGASVTVHPETDIHYTVVASNQYNCTDTAIAVIWVHPDAVIHLGDSVRLYPGETFQLNPQTNCSAFMWTPPGGLSNPYIANPVASPSISTKYVLYGETSWGCETRDSINIYVEVESLIALPNAFTPGTGINKEFKILLKGLVNLNYFRIWNRWGQLVFETTDINKGWDGTFNGEPQPEGVFIYQVQGVTSTDRVLEKHGNVTLIR